MVPPGSCLVVKSCRMSLVGVRVCRAWLTVLRMVREVTEAVVGLLALIRAYVLCRRLGMRVLRVLRWEKSRPWVVLGLASYGLITLVLRSLLVLLLTTLLVMSRLVVVSFVMSWSVWMVKARLLRLGVMGTLMRNDWSLCAGWVSTVGVRTEVPPSLVHWFMIWVAVEPVVMTLCSSLVLALGIATALTRDWVAVLDSRDRC